MHRATSLVFSIALIGTTTEAIAQRPVSPVTINPGAPSGLGNSGLTINLTPSYPYAYGGFPGVYGGGLYGGGVIISNGGYGYGPGFGYAGSGGFPALGFGPGSIGDSPWGDPVARQQQYALANSRYEMQNAQASEAYAKANYFQQQAIATSIQNAKASQSTPPIRERYNAKTTKAKGASHAVKAPETLPLDKLMTRSGGILWPSAAPKGGSRDDLDAAMGTLAKQFQETGKVDVQDVNVAREALQSYGVPALTQVRREKPAQASAMKLFLNSLDATLVSWAK